MAFAAVAAAGIAGGAVIGGGLLQGNATQKAAQIQADAENNALDFQKQEYADQSPYRQAGKQALSQMGDPYFQQNFTGQGMLDDDPGYQFRMDQGEKALEASAAARGGLMGGNMGTALAQYGQNYASNEYQNAYNRFNNNQTQRFNRLASLAGIGQTANAQGSLIASDMANTTMSGANARGAAAIAGGQIAGNTLSNLGNTAMQYGIMSKYGPQNQPLDQYGTTRSQLTPTDELMD